MFIESYTDSDNITLAFIKSTNVQAFPCGRRRSMQTIVNNSTTNFPFDPEARLNTEKNNISHSGVNGYTQTYLKSWDESNKLLTLSVAGYLFSITLDSGYISPEQFGTKVAALFDTGDYDYIYANIVTEKTHLFSGFQEYFTQMLSKQSAVDSQSLDLLRTVRNGESAVELSKNSANYYFSGLSFSPTPLVTKVAAYNGLTYDSQVIPAIYDSETRSISTPEKTITSLRILKKDRGNWEIYQPALLPKIEHGDTEDSVVVTGAALLKSNLYVEDNINVGSLDNDEKATDNDGGCIVAKNDITAKRDLSAERNLTVATHTKTQTLEVTATITASDIGTTDNKVSKLITTEADVGTLTVNTLNASDIQQKIGNDYKDVPVIFLKEQTEDNRTVYQLQISRVNSIN